MLAEFSNNKKFKDKNGRERDCMGILTAKRNGRNSHSFIINREIIDGITNINSIAKKLIGEYPENNINWARKRIINHVKFFHEEYKENHNYKKSLSSIHGDPILRENILKEYQKRTIHILK